MKLESSRDRLARGQHPPTISLREAAQEVGITHHSLVRRLSNSPNAPQPAIKARAAFSSLGNTYYVASELRRWMKENITTEEQSVGVCKDRETISQRIAKLLKENPGGLTTKQLSDAVGARLGAVAKEARKVAHIDRWERGARGRPGGVWVLGAGEDCPPLNKLGSTERMALYRERVKQRSL